MMSEFDLGTSQGPTLETTFLDLLRRQMSGQERTRRKRSLKERLRFKCMGCCGPAWGQRLTNNNNTSPTSREVPGSAPSMNLATALEAERDNRRETMTPTRVSLMRLLEETAPERVVDEERETEILTVSIGTIVMSSDPLCCVCMGRKKGAAFIPCGHTFCRVCSRELWLNRRSCPLCNRPIIEILDIF